MRRESHVRIWEGVRGKLSRATRPPAMTPTSANHALLRLYDRASRDLGLGAIPALDPGKRGAGDISLVALLLPSLDGLGGQGGGAHMAEEYVDLDKLPELSKRAALFIYRLGDGQEPGRREPPEREAAGRR